MLKSKSSHIDRYFNVLKKKRFWLMAVAISFALFRFGSELDAVSSEPMLSWKEEVRADCAVVLTGGAGRVREGFNLLVNGQVKKLIISGVHQNVHIHDIFPLWPLYGRVSENDVVLERRSETTFGNAQQSAPIIEALKCRDIALITSRLHMYRSYKTFRAALPDSIMIYRHPVIAGRLQSPIWERFIEAIKSLFYSAWAYLI